MKKFFARFKYSAAEAIKRHKSTVQHGEQWELVSIDPTLEITCVRLRIGRGYLYAMEFKDGEKEVVFVPDGSTISTEG